MYKPTQVANVLLLKGLFIDDFTIKESVYEITSEAEYSPIPKKFTGVETWPKASNLRCWRCDLVPTSYPIFIPMNPEKDENGNDICDAMFHFDDWSCAIDYIKHEFPLNQQADAIARVYIFARKFGIRGLISPAIPKTVMKTYMGNTGLTPEAYRELRRQICYHSSN
jgi:hypothetical protein